VGPSVKNPSEYYNNNVAKTLKLLDIVKQSMPRCRLVFSSSAATYGEPIMNPIHEVDPKEPVSPYGESKLMIDMMLESYHRAYGTDYVSFRYFNACGADPKGRHGQEPGATHLIAKFLEAARAAMVEKLISKILNVKDSRDNRGIFDINIFEILANLHEKMESEADKRIIREEIVALRNKIQQDN
jgi:UDP-glucose 4-epimerase